ncbi:MULTISPECIES: DUF421 domain-containing protein [Rhodococcus]|uniref:DUF421 domain-containing protein n=1 Tax=Rhodococcus TaxID=1827 RepID=UPI0007E9DE20|nr:MULTISPECIES: YetF domain-containing protein [Rhodococcus]OBA38226.1 hypothetical protein A5767_05770 [Rhodococcus sp. 852002-51564_SCH6189132-a]QQM55716.1 DUF421 domain-containing protein [Rhodococcus pyridinivorans]
MWFGSWSDLMRVVLVGAAAYLWLVFVLRISGKRTLAKLNAFDLVVTVALGSTLATILLSSDVPWSEGAVALVLLAGLQFLAAAVSSRWPRSRAVLTADPTLLVEHGAMLDLALAQQRISPGEVRQAVRASGFGDLGQVAAVVLETDGSLSVIGHQQYGNGSVLDDVAHSASGGHRRSSRPGGDRR